MSSEPALSIQGLTKRYRIAKVEDRADFFVQAVLRRARRPFRRRTKEDFLALDNVSLDVAAGEAVGIIGRNGAGKSTLLKIVSRTVEPTAGRVELYGRVGCLLEVGVGFHPELTGRENIYLNGAILGMKKREISEQFDSIVDFAQIERFLDTPVKRYSSGMYVRLAFAVAAHLSSDILIVDEVLAVGDAEFQKKCLGKMGDVTRQDGRTVLFVSHNMAAVEALCPRCIHLHEGRVVFDGPTPKAIENYRAGMGDPSSDGTFDLTGAPRPSRIGSLILQRVRILGPDGQPTGTVRSGDGLSIAIDVDGLRFPTQGVVVRILTANEVPLVAMNTVMRLPEVFMPRARQDEVLLRVPHLPLAAGRYYLEIAVTEGGRGAPKTTPDHVERAAAFEVVGADVYGSGFQPVGGGRFGAQVFVDLDWEIRSKGRVVASTASAPNGKAPARPPPRPREPHPKPPADRVRRRRSRPDATN